MAVLGSQQPGPEQQPLEPSTFPKEWLEQRMVSLGWVPAKAGQQRKPEPLAAEPSQQQRLELLLMAAHPLQRGGLEPLVGQASQEGMAVVGCQQLRPELPPLGPTFLEEWLEQQMVRLDWVAAQAGEQREPEVLAAEP